MIPYKIHMKDFISFEDETFDFEKIHSATVIGKNGAGKSSFCTDAITWALFGQGSKGGANDRANYVRRGANACLVEFEFGMSNNRYKVVRNYNNSNKKTALILFGYSEAGDEIALSDGAVDAQKKINTLLRMSYEVFTASSIVLQNQIHSFTEGMKDSQKKDTLLNILNVNIWEAYRKKNADAVKALKTELDMNEGKLRLSGEIVSREEAVRAQLAEAEKAISEGEAVVASARSAFDSANAALSQAKMVEESLGSLRSLIASKESSLRMQEGTMNNLSAEIANAQSQQKTLSASIEKLDKIVAHADEIRSAVEREKVVTSALDAMKTVKGQYETCERNLDNIKKMGAGWNDAHAQKIQSLEVRLGEKQQQASLVVGVPCANTDISPKCPLLKMAYEAKNACAAIEQEIASVKAETNPYREQWVTENNALKALAPQFNNEQIAAYERELVEVQKYSRLADRLETASEQIDGFRKMLTDAQNLETAKTSDRKAIADSLPAMHVEIEKLKEDLSVKTAQNNFAAIESDFAVKKSALEQAEVRERTSRERVANINAELSQIENEKKRIDEIKQEVERLEQEKSLLDLFGEACNRVNGVPAFMVAAAIPELEASANAVLEKMMDGRLQIHFRTSKDDSDEVGALFRIDVSEQSEVEPRDFSTFSGAEKFIMALAIRIAMSQFLAHRAGAAVQLFVLDEGVSCADEDNREEVIRALRNISDDFAKVLFITHDEELKDALESKIVVSKDSRGSHLSLAA